MSDGMIAQFTQMAHAIKLLRQGYRTPIVVIETGLGTTKVRKLAKDLHHGARQTSGALPSSPYFVSCMPALADASLFASIYRSMGGRSIFESIDTDLLFNAHKIYMEVRSRDIYLNRTPLTINQCWVLARDLRSSMAWIRRCDEDKYIYIAVDGQKMSHGCPWCSIRRTVNQERLKIAS